MKKYLYFLLPLIYVALDHITKFLVIKNIPYYSSVKINDYFSIVNISNTGVAFSMFQNNNLIFISTGIKDEEYQKTCQILDTGLIDKVCVDIARTFYSRS